MAASQLEQLQGQLAFLLSEQQRIEPFIHESRKNVSKMVAGHIQALGNNGSSSITGPLLLMDTNLKNASEALGLAISKVRAKIAALQAAANA